VSDSSRSSRNLSLIVKVAGVFSFYGVAIYSVEDGAFLDLEELLSLSAFFM
jgi:hypothetical protein